MLIGQTKAFRAVLGIKPFLGSKRTIKEIISDPLAKEVGLAYEAWVPNYFHRMDIPKDKPYLVPDPQKYDQNGFALDPRLKEFIKQNFYLPESVLNYDQIKVEFIKRI